MSAIRTAIDAFLDARDRAAAWADGRFTEEASRKERERQLQPAREALEARIDPARTKATEASAAYAEAVNAALTDDSDNTRVLARELAWQRLQRRIERGEAVETIARDASPVELEALNAFAAPEMPHLGHGGPTLFVDEWRTRINEIAGEAYGTQPQFADLAGQATGASESATPRRPRDRAHPRGARRRGARQPHLQLGPAAVPARAGVGRGEAGGAPSGLPTLVPKGVAARAASLPPPPQSPHQQPLRRESLPGSQAGGGAP